MLNYVAVIRIAMMEKSAALMDVDMSAGLL